MEWLNVIKMIAPTVASALGTPLAGIAVSALGSLFGVSDPTQEKLKEFVEKSQLTPEMIMEMKKMELQFQSDEEERGFKYTELEYKDLENAREREVETKDNTNRIIAFIILFSFVGMSASVLFGWSQAESVLSGTIIGYISAKCEQVFSYYFGSTKSSSRKTELIANSASSTPTKQ